MSKSLLSKNHKWQAIEALYLHIPFCSALCHYCDFAKTARFDDQMTKSYFEALRQHTKYWLEKLAIAKSSLTTLYFGGGTPGLFAAEYAPLFELLEPYLTAEAELTLEANPNNLTNDHLQIWKELGINRLSIGVQSFDAKALKWLKRDHTANQALSALSAARLFFANISLDLIYAWPGQTIESWRQDLDLASSLRTKHISLYSLTYEARTPIGRAHHRGKLPAMPADSEQELLAWSDAFWGAQGFDHYEVSNWALAGYKSRHNQVYWEDKPYLGIGPGAHGYLHDGTAQGVRYAYPTSLKRFVEQPLSETFEIDTTRRREHRAMEYIGSSLRTKKGVKVSHLEMISGCDLQANQTVEWGLKTGKLEILDGYLRLCQEEWIRENAWAGELVDSLEYSQLKAKACNS